MKQLKTEAITLDTVDVFDADRSLLLFTQEVGKVRARARGVRKPTSRLGGHLLPYLPVMVELVMGSGGYLVTQAQLSDNYRKMVYPDNPLAFLQQAGTVSEAVNRLFIDNEPHPAIYEGLVYTLGRLLDRCVKGEEVGVVAITAEFLLKCLVELGYTPELYQCVVTSQPVTAEFTGWSHSLGGVLSEAGYREVADRYQVQSKTVVALREFSKPTFMAERLGMPPEVAQETFETIFGYLQYQIGQPLKSLGNRVTMTRPG